MASAKGEGGDSVADLLDKLKKLHPEAAEKGADAIDELAWAIITDCDCEAEAAWQIVAALKKNFVDWNEARVSRICDLARVMGGCKNAESAASRLRECLSRVFDRQGEISLAFLKEMKIGDARRALNELEPVGKAVADRILMLENQDAGYPFSNEAVELAKRWKLIPKAGNRQHLNKALDCGLSRPDTLAFFRLLEFHAADGCPKAKCPLCKK